MRSNKPFARHSRDTVGSAVFAGAGDLLGDVGLLKEDKIQTIERGERVVDEDDLNKNPLQEIDSLIERAREMSQQELLDQVYRRVTIYLCLPCYTEWIENPAG